MLAAIIAVSAVLGVVVLAVRGKISGVFTEGYGTFVPDDNALTDTPQDNPDDTYSAPLPQDISTDPATWPSGNRVWDICRAIALAEGYNVGGSVPFTLNNPGDISDGASTFGSQAHSGSNVTVFPDAATGWNWLYNKISNHINGLSSTYPRTMTITKFSQKYAGNWLPWKTIVGKSLGVNPDTTTFADYVG